MLQLMQSLLWYILLLSVKNSRTRVIGEDTKLLVLLLTRVDANKSDVILLFRAKQKTKKMQVWDIKKTKSRVFPIRGNESFPLSRFVPVHHSFVLPQKFPDNNSLLLKILFQRSSFFTLSQRKHEFTLAG